MALVNLTARLTHEEGMLHCEVPELGQMYMAHSMDELLRDLPEALNELFAVHHERGSLKAELARLGATTVLGELLTAVIEFDTSLMPPSERSSLRLHADTEIRLPRAA